MKPALTGPPVRSSCSAFGPGACTDSDVETALIAPKTRIESNRFETVHPQRSTDTRIPIPWTVLTKRILLLPLGVATALVLAAPAPAREDSVIAPPTVVEEPQVPEHFQGLTQDHGVTALSTSPSGHMKASGPSLPNDLCSSLANPLVLSPSGGTSPDAAADPVGRVHVVWQGSDKNIWYAQVGADGTMAVPATVAYQKASSGSSPRVAVDDAGDAHIVFTSGGSFQGICYAKVSGGKQVAKSAFTMFSLTSIFDDQVHSSPSIAINPVTQLPVVAAEVSASYEQAIGPFPVTVWQQAYSQFLSMRLVRLCDPPFSPPIQLRPLRRHNSALTIPRSLSTQRERRM